MEAIAEGVVLGADDVASPTAIAPPILGSSQALAALKARQGADNAFDHGREPSASSSAVPGRPRATPTSPGVYQAAPETVTPRRLAGAGSEANPLLTAIRRELKASEERLTERVTRVERRAEQFRDAAFASMDEKFAEVRGKLPEYERKMAEMGGCVQGVQDELQALVRRVSSMDHAHSQRRTEEVPAKRANVIELEVQEIAAMKEKILGLQASFDELAGGAGRVDMAEVQLERLTEAYEREFVAEGRSREGPPSSSRTESTSVPGASGNTVSPSMSQIMQCERMAREAEEAAEKAAREAERLSLQVRQAMTQSEEQKARMLTLMERVSTSEQELRGMTARAAMNANDPLGAPERLMSADGSEGQQASEPRFSPRGFRAEVDEMKYDMERSWKGMLEVKEAVELVNEKFTRDLKALKEGQRTLHRLDSHRSSEAEGSPLSSRGNNGKASIVTEVQALRDCILKGEAAIRSLAPRLLEAAKSSQDLDFSQSAKGLQAVIGSPEEDDYEEESQCQSPMSRNEFPSPVVAAPRGKAATSCFGGCFRGS